MRPQLSVRDIPEADRILHCALPIVHLYGEYPGLGGTCFAVRFNGRLFFLTAGHVISGSANDEIGIPLSFGDRVEYMDIDAVARPAIRDKEDPDWLDLAVILSRGQPELDETKIVEHDLERLADMRNAVPGSIFAVSGYPRNSSSIDYEKLQISHAFFLTPAFYTGPTAWKWCHRLVLDRYYEDGMDGMSGGPVVKVVHDGAGNWDAALAGMLLRGGGGKNFYFLDGLVLLGALRELAAGSS